MKKILAWILALSVLITGLSVIPAAAEQEPPSGLWGEYYAGDSFDRFVTAKNDPTLDFAWSTGTSPVAGMEPEHYSIRWTGRIQAETTGTYTFTTSCDDGVMLWIDGERIIRDAGPHGAMESSGSARLEAGKFYSIRVEYYNGYGGGELKLYWNTDDGEREIVPAENLFLPEEKARVTLSYTDNGEVATAMLLRPADTPATLVLEKYDASGRLIDTLASARDASAFTWEVTDILTDEKDFSYKAYVVDTDGNTISNLASAIYGVDNDLVIDAAETSGEVSPLLYGACLEDVNHELYGGIWSQMIFGESFAEAPSSGFDGFTAAGGSWYTKEAEGQNEIWIDRTDSGPKLVIDHTECTTGTVSADVYVSGDGPAGFIIKVTDPKAGSDSFNGYEIGLRNNSLRIARHEYNYTLISDTPCTAPTNSWNNIRVEMTANSMQVYVNDEFVSQYTDSSPLETGLIGFRAWNSTAGFKNIRVDLDGQGENAVEIPVAQSGVETSGMWRFESSGSAEGGASLLKTGSFSGSQSQRLTFSAGSGAVSIDNMGLNRMGMSFVAEKEYTGYFYAKSDTPVEAFAVLESADGAQQYAEVSVAVSGSEWTKYSFTLTPSATDDKGRFSIELRSAGTLDIGYVFLEPGEWGRYKGLHVRKDVAERLEQQNLTVLRFGGSMINNNGYKWKRMLGEPEFRENYNGTWYANSSFGFGIIEFLELCEALGVAAVPTFNSYETPQDMADFIQFATGTDSSNEWVQKRIEMGRSEPFDLEYLQIGNEEKIDETFAARFNSIATEIWKVGTDITLIAGDFVHDGIISDPYDFTGAWSGITSLSGHKSILDNATQNRQTVWFDLHCFKDVPTDIANYFAPAISFYDALKSICPESDFKLVCFELNSGNHTFSRALANAVAITKAEHLSDIFAIVCSANCLQVDGQNDNGWDQGLVFMDSDATWYQPAAYITQMAAAYYLPYTVEHSLSSENDKLYISTTRSEDGTRLVVKLANTSEKNTNLQICIPEFADKNITMTLVSYADSLDAVNTAEDPEASKPEEAVVTQNALQDGKVVCTAKGNSYTVIVFDLAGEMPLLYGDMDQNGYLTVSDVVALRQVIVTGSPTEYERTAGDMDQNGYLTVSDVVALRSAIVSGTAE